MAGVLTTPAAGTPPPVERLPPLRQELTLTTGHFLEDGSPSWVLYDPVRNRYHRLGSLEVEILKQWQEATPETVAGACREVFGRRVEKVQVEEVARFLSQHGLVQGSGPQFRKRLLKQSTPSLSIGCVAQKLLFFRRPLLYPDRLLTTLFPYIAFLYHPNWRRTILALLAVGGLLLLRQWDGFLHTFTQFFSLEGAMYMGGALILSKTAHELGHACTAKRYGLRVDNMGVALLFFIPVLYTEVSEIWRLTDRQARMNIAAAGIKAETILAVLCLFFWNFLPDGPLRAALFLTATGSWLMTILVNLNPLMRYDGYYLLSDWLNMPNLQERANAMGRWWLRERLLGLALPAPEAITASRQRILLAYAGSAWVYRFVLFLGLGMVAYAILFKLLGMIFFAMSISMFLLRPILSELLAWWRMRRQLRWNRHVLVSLGVTLGMVLVFVVPWRATVEMAAVMTVEQRTRLFAPQSARIRQVLTAPGRTVQRGDPLLILEAPHLVYDRQQSQDRIALLELRLKHHGNNAETRAQVDVDHQELAREMARNAGLANRFAKLTIVAPFSGTVVAMADNLLPGRWVSSTLPLVQILDPTRPIVEGFLAEDDLARIETGAGGIFLPNPPELPPVPVQLVRLDRANTEILEFPMLATYNGGTIAANPDQQGRLHTVVPVYRAHLALPETQTAAQQLVAGVVHLQGRRESLLGRVWRHAVAVIIRETGM